MNKDLEKLRRQTLRRESRSARDGHRRGIYTRVFFRDRPEVRAILVRTRSEAKRLIAAGRGDSFEKFEVSHD